MIDRVTVKKKYTYTDKHKNKNTRVYGGRITIRQKIETINGEFLALVHLFFGIESSKGAKKQGVEEGIDSSDGMLERGMNGGFCSTYAYKRLSAGK